MQIRNFEQEANACKNIIEILQNQLAEKDAMIDWLVEQLVVNAGLVPVKDWRKAAQKAVKNE